VLSEVTELRIVERTLDDLADADGALVISTVAESRRVREVQGVATYDVMGARVVEIADALHEACVSGDQIRVKVIRP